ncbi:Malectin/receptor protein kinase family protein [Hibiscus syriacus]|uniref:Malectin/receptor protein kinase family protein n=1 Tax=Hibiscus syriacus TaxID=106335 RepID=A0A6A2X947_HIBSY|nr:receptor-like protein kinase FERONIA [Hibiscus syriacus]KAE8654929.1 Malectin/receptor protein kinase family protein [Hibiscus syriacus]
MLSESTMGDPPRFLSSFFGVFKKGKSNGKKQTRFQNPVALPEEIHHQFSLPQIKAATNNFHRDLILGEGGFGTVYKGFFNDGKSAVVKRGKLESEPGASYKEFRTELLMLCQLRHQHLVPLIGFCFEMGEMILVYEYMGDMRNGTLPDRLYGSGYDPLPWKQRLEICIGAARGLHYLHTGAKRAIVHGNVKSGNILLDKKWGCKLSDFRTSKLRPRRSCKPKASERIDPLVQSNLAYLDPEYLETAQLEEKCDVYSFGVVLFEVLCARRPFVEHDGEMKTTTLVDLACKSIKGGTIYDMIDPYLKGRIAPECFKLFVDIAGSCTRVVGD